MRLLCRLGRHSPLLDKQLIDVTRMKQETHCKRCGVPMHREFGAPWQVQLPVRMDQARMDQAPMN